MVQPSSDVANWYLGAGVMIGASLVIQGMWIPGGKWYVDQHTLASPKEVERSGLGI